MTENAGDGHSSSNNPRALAKIALDNRPHQQFSCCIPG
jgi:hypothetical protein